MLAFLDTEFTDLAIRPRLLSVAIVTTHECGREFYAEVTDRDRVHATNWFGLSAVLPQFGKVADAACSYAELATRLCAFMGDMVAGLQSGEFIDLTYGYHMDWELIDLAGQDAGTRLWASIRRLIRPLNVYDLTGFGSGKSAAEAYFNAQALAPFSRHHALCDARALRAAYEAATRPAATPGLTTKPTQGQSVTMVAT